nr:hypothetical protein [Tanacetum cinerariifolium]
MLKQREQAANLAVQQEQAVRSFTPDWNFSMINDDEEHSIQYKEYLDNSSNTITPVLPTEEPEYSLSMGVENIVPNPSESKGENGCDVHACFTTFLNILFDAEYEFDSVDNQSLHNDDFLGEIFSNPLFEEEINSMRIGEHHSNVASNLIGSLLNHDSSIIPSSSKIDSLLDEFVSENSNADIESFSPSPIMEEIDLTFTPDDPMPPSIKEDDDDSRDTLIYSNTGILNIKMMGDVSNQKVPTHGLTITLVSNQEKSPDLLSHRGLENFQPSAESQMKIHGKNIPTLDVPRLIPKDFILQVFISSASIGNYYGRIEEEQAAKAQSWKFPVCYDNDDDEEGYNSLNDNIISELPSYSAVTPTEPIDSLSMGGEHLDTIPATESDEFIKSCVENLVPNPSESNGENECDVPAGFTTFSNVLFDDDYDFDSSDDQSLSGEDVREKIYSNPLFNEEIIPMEIDQHSFNVESDLIKSMPNHDSSIIISSKIDSLF